LIAKRDSKSEIVKRAYVLLSLDENRPGGRLSDESIRHQYHVGQRMIERVLRKSCIESFAGRCYSQFPATVHSR
jgi:hypothetical protein